MNVGAMRIPQEVAREKLREYRSRAHRRADAEYQKVLHAYEQAAAGRAIVNLEQAIRNAPADDIGRPRLAIARADRKVVRLRWPSHSESLRFDSFTNRAGDPPRNAKGLRITVDMGRRHGRKEYRSYAGRDVPVDLEGQSLVPLVPPKVLRELPHTDLKRYFTLFEVESWAYVPPIDPYIMTHLGGDLYAVMGEWDLTDIERAVMQEFRN